MTILDAPADLNLTATGHTTVQAQWNPLAGVADYEYLVVEPGQSGTWVPLTDFFSADPARVLEITGLSPATTYRVGVRGTDLDGPGPDATGLVATPGRHHFYRAVRDAAGALQPGSTISLFVPGTSVPVDFPVYTDNEGGTQRGSIWVAEDGVVDFYTETSATIDVAVSTANGWVVFRDVALGSGTGGGGGTDPHTHPLAEIVLPEGLYLGVDAVGGSSEYGSWAVASYAMEILDSSGGYASLYPGGLTFYADVNDEMTGTSLVAPYGGRFIGYLPDEVGVTLATREWVETVTVPAPPTGGYYMLTSVDGVMQWTPGAS